MKAEKINTVQIGDVNYNADYAKKVGEEQWLKDHEHHGATSEHFKEVTKDVTESTAPAKAEKAKK